MQNKITYYTLDTLCDRGHPLIKFNCISTKPGSLNYALDECPMCSRIKELELENKRLRKNLVNAGTGFFIMAMILLLLSVI